MKLNMGGNAASAEGKDGTVVWSDNATVYRTPSGSRQGLFHFTFSSNDGASFSCTCEGFQFRGKCKHITTAEEIHFQAAQRKTFKGLPTDEG